LIAALPRLAPRAKIVVDLPSRLSDRLAAGELDVALIPSIEYARTPGSTVVADACVACDGPVKSVKLYGRVPPERIERLALDEGSRTSAVLSRILLAEWHRIRPEIEILPIGAMLNDSTADAVLLIGDRAMRPPCEDFAFVWDLGERWSRWTGTPFVFAMWVARPGINLDGISQLFAAARDEGVGRLDEIARAEASRLGLPESECLSYLRDHLRFYLGPREKRSLATFFRLAAEHRLIDQGARLVFCDS
jgi:chorismate dehydratase